MEFFIDLSSYIKLSEYGEAIPNENLISSNIVIKWVITKSSSTFQKKKSTSIKNMNLTKLFSRRFYIDLISSGHTNDFQFQFYFE